MGEGRGRASEKISVDLLGRLFLDNAGSRGNLLTGRRETPTDSPVWNSILVTLTKQRDKTMANQKQAGTLAMGFNGKMTLELSKGIISFEKKANGAETARGAVIDRLEAEGWDPTVDFDPGTETREWLKQQITEAKYGRDGLNRYLSKKADISAEQWAQRDAEQATVSSRLTNFKTALTKRLAKAALIAEGKDPKVEAEKEKARKAAENTPAKRLTTLMDSAKKLLMNAENEFPAGLNRQAHIERIDKILANLGSIEQAD